MVVTISFPIIAARAVAKRYFAHQSGFFQISQRVINRSETDCRQAPSCGRKNFCRRRVRVTRANNVEHGLALTCQRRLTCLRLFTRRFPVSFHWSWNYTNSKLEVKGLRRASFTRQTLRLRARLPLMLANRLGLKKKLRAALAFTLVLWCAGTGCMLVSYAHGASMANPEAASAQASGSTWTGVSASAGTHSCCKARHSSQHASTIANRHASVATGLEEAALLGSSNPADAMSCCPLTSGTFVVTTRQAVSDERASEATKSQAPAFVLAHMDAAPRALPLRLPNQNQTYLRCCSFLI